MVERYIYSSAVIFGSVKVGPNTEMTLHQQMIEITSYDSIKLEILETFDETEKLSASSDAFPVPVAVTTVDINGTGRDRKNIKCNIR